MRWFRRAQPAPQHPEKVRHEMRLMFTTDRCLFLVDHNSARYEIHPGIDIRWAQVEGYRMDPSCATLIEAGLESEGSPS